MKGRDRAALRADAHHLSPTVHVGAQGLTDALVGSLEDALRTRQLVKVKIGKGTTLPIQRVAESLAELTEAEVIQVIGRTVTLFRAKPEADTP